MVLVRARMTFAFRPTDVSYFFIRYFSVYFFIRKQYRFLEEKKNHVPAYLTITMGT